MNSKKNIAILFFSRRAKAEIHFKQWLPKANKFNTELAESLILHTYDTVAKTGLPVYHVHEGMQQGRNFGERFANAFQQIFDLGYDGVIAVGNDSPGLAHLDWTKPIQGLHAGQCALGPTFRGGTYLIALTRERFCKTGFERISWQTDKVLVELQEYCRVKHEPILLQTARDLNSLNDLRVFVRTSELFIPVRRFIQALLAAIKGWSPSRFVVLFYWEFRHRSWSLRAPPGMS